ncbi:hypothetical protein IB277_07095 [Ensifer sp. ENS07]|uniref:hypothetical protein n=1 Tax=Ensifer sp. ENS07 TaxID=2769274 RepID=UPI00177D4378|nr:hypothetical protein [Ensifer sp. ENS07]MBD9636058.1 hypothetical protein [Ensifer sp. ENS07]
MTNVRRLRPVPAIAVELDEGSRLRRATGEAGLEKAQGAEQGRPRQPWSEDIYNVQMMARVAVTLINEVFTNVRAMEDLHEIALHEQIGFDELCFQVHALRHAAEALQPQ